MPVQDEYRRKLMSAADAAASVPSGVQVLVAMELMVVHQEMLAQAITEALEVIQDQTQRLVEQRRMVQELHQAVLVTHSTHQE